jgi:dihydrofolate reductase
VIRLIAAIDEKRGIATDRGIPWQLPRDKAYFESQTATGLIVMGLATYNEFTTPLHDRTNYVLTTDSHPLRVGFQAIVDLDDVIRDRRDEDVWIIGGSFVFAETINRAKELFITQVRQDFHCTKFFPEYSREFVLFDQSRSSVEGGVSYRFEKWRRNVVSRTPDSPSAFVAS